MRFAIACANVPLFTVILGISFSSLGCSGTIHPPRVRSGFESIYLTDYGRHSSLVLPTDDGGFVEWAYGDWNWFALGRTKWYNALGAVFISPQATLAREPFPRPSSPEALQAALGAVSMTRINVSPSRVDALMSELETRYEKQKATELTDKVTK